MNENEVCCENLILVLYIEKVENGVIRINKCEKCIVSDNVSVINEGKEGSFGY